MATQEELNAIARFYQASLTLFGSAIDARERTGRAIDGHGDLRLEHICLAQDPPALLGRIEFDPTLRYGDVALDLSFLVLELHEAGRPDLAQEFVWAYVRETLDAEVPALLDLFCIHRALVRAKVQSILSRQREVYYSKRIRPAARADRLFSLARTLARPLWIVMTGRPGTGKSTIAAELARGLDRGCWLRPKRFGHGIPRKERYALSGLAQVYERLRDRAVQRARGGYWSILDASFLDPTQGKEVERAAAEAGADVLWVRCHCPEEVAIERIVGRVSAKVDAIDARTSQRVPLAVAYQPPDEIPPRRRLDLCTLAPREELATVVRMWAFHARPIAVLQHPGGPPSPMGGFSCV